jgi:hypothetical protein
MEEDGDEKNRTDASGQMTEDMPPQNRKYPATTR